jgi:signal transduction histidine kinase
MDHPSLMSNDWKYKIVSSDVGIFDKVEESISDKDSVWLNVKGSMNNDMKDIKSIIYYRTNLPVNKVEDPHLLFQTNDQAFEVYVNKKLIYSFGDFYNFNYKDSPGAPTHLIPLPDGYQNKELVIAMKSISKKNLGLIRTIELDSKGNHFMRIFKMNIGTLILGCLSIIIGMACMFVGIVRRLGRKALFSLGLLFIVVGTWSIAENALTQIFHFRPVFWFYVAVISLYLIPVGVYKFIMDISNINKKVITWLIHIHLILFAFSYLLNITGTLAFINTMILYYTLTGISYIICIVVSIQSYLKGNGEALIYTVGQIVFGIFGVYDVLGWYFRIIPWTVNMAPWGMFVFQLALLYALKEYLKDTQDRFLQYNNELREKEKQINEAMEYDKIKTEFFANVSHEMRTPLNIIHTTNQLIKVYNDKGIIGGKESNLDKYIGIMNQNCYRLMKLADNLIDIAKIESGFYLLNFKKVNIVSLVEDITMSIETHANNKGIKLVFDTEWEERLILCDPDAIERIMLNLLSNAIKFSEDGDSIYVNLKMGEGNIYIEVEDTGIGIPRDKLDSVFARFVQVDKSFTRKNEGSGIGLAIVKALVEMHSGTIDLVSDLNKGSKFRIALPAKLDETIIIEEDDYNENYQDKMEKVAIEFSDIYYN